MPDPLQVYREAMAQHAHVDAKADCYIERFLPDLVQLAKAVGPDDPQTFEAACEQIICAQCGQREASGFCRARAQAACCLYRDLPLLYDALHRVHAGSGA